MSHYLSIDMTRRIKTMQKTLGEAIKNHTHNIGTNRFNCIRRSARYEFRHLTVCEGCGYDKHVEMCHIKPLTSFSLDTLVSVINDRSNIKVLCPNCHWEFDNHHKLVTHEGIEPSLAD